MKRLYSLITIIVALLLALAGASQQSYIMGGFFGFILALAIDEFFASLKKNHMVDSEKGNQ